MGAHLHRMLCWKVALVVEQLEELAADPRAARYRGTSLIRNSALLGPYSRTLHRALWWVLGGGSLSYERGSPCILLEEDLAARSTRWSTTERISTECFAARASWGRVWGFGVRARVSGLGVRARVSGSGDCRLVQKYDSVGYYPSPRRHGRVLTLTPGCGCRRAANPFSNPEASTSPRHPVEDDPFIRSQLASSD